MVRKEKDGIVWFEFKHLADTGLVNHCFSSRIGGVSKHPFNTLNLAYHMGDEKLIVDENFKRIKKAVGFGKKKIVLTKQIHENKVENLDHTCEVSSGTDGLITSNQDLILTSYFADCVPLFILDPVKKVIANSHAGWRGTSLNIANATVKRLIADYDSNPSDLLIGIGPSISQKHFEVGHEVAETFLDKLPQLRSFMEKKSCGKWHLDLWAMNKQLFIEAGVKESNVQISKLCTFSDPEHFYSHRRDGTARGNMAAMISLKS